MLPVFSFLASESFSGEDLSLEPVVVGRSSVEASSTFFFLPFAQKRVIMGLGLLDNKRLLTPVSASGPDRDN